MWPHLSKAMKTISRCCWMIVFCRTWAAQNVFQHAFSIILLSLLSLGKLNAGSDWWFPPRRIKKCDSKNNLLFQIYVIWWNVGRHLFQQNFQQSKKSILRNFSASKLSKTAGNCFSSVSTKHGTHFRHARGEEMAGRWDFVWWLSISTADDVRQTKRFEYFTK